MRHGSSKFIIVLLGCALLMASFVNGAGFYAPHASAAQLQNRSLEISDSSAGAHDVSYNVTFSIVTAGTIGSIEIQFCSNSTFLTDPCVAPFGLDANNVVLASQSMSPGFAISPDSSVNNIILSRLPVAASAGPANFRFTNLINPTNPGSYYVRVLTHSSNDASGPSTDSGGMAFALNGAVNVSTEVPPYLAFCTGTNIIGTDCSTSSGDYIDLGEFSPARTSGGQTQMVAATNAENGYNISINGTTLTSGNNTIPEMSTGGVPTLGSSQFGINLRANTNPSVGANPSGPGHGVAAVNYDQPNQYRYKSGDTVADSSTADDYRKYTITYMVNVSKNQAVGVYASTFTYVALANF
jgi:hypothetical protein